MRTVRASLLLATGFLLGTAALALSNGMSLFDQLSYLLPNTYHSSRLADISCVPNTDNEEIFFISCGGVY